MLLTPLIDHLKLKIPAFSQRIAVCVNFKQLLEDEPRMALPALYIMLGDEEGEPVFPEKQIYIQGTTQNIYCFLVIDNTHDPFGQLSQDKVDAFRIYLLAALANYQYIPEFAYPIEFLRSGIAYIDRGRYIHNFQFVLKQQIDFTDGFKIDNLPDLNEIFGEINLTGASDDTPAIQTINNFI